jgi:hypothetical protein
MQRRMRRGAKHTSAVVTVVGGIIQLADQRNFGTSAADQPTELLRQHGQVQVAVVSFRTRISVVGTFSTRMSGRVLRLRRTSRVFWSRPNSETIEEGGAQC